MEEDLEKRLEEELNEEEAADEAEDPKPKKGKKAKEEKQKISLDWDMDPIERLTVEMNSLDESAYMARAIAEYLIEEFKKDENLKEAYKNRKVTLEEIVSHITKEAQKAKEAEEKKRLREQEAARKRQSESMQMSLFDMLGGDDDAN